ncbi:MAG: YraN family protein [Dehalococcoidia bacterium]
MRRNEFGALGERIAADHLAQRGLRIVGRNVRYREGEIDLVAEEGDTIVFVEVRARRGEAFGTPEESLTPRKQAHLVLAAQRYLAATGREGADWRIDLVAIALTTDGRLLRVTHLRSAVEG